MSETPRTDAWAMRPEIHGTPSMGSEFVDAHLCRTLELELSRTREAQQEFGRDKCVMCDSKNIERGRTKTTCRDCGTVSTDNPQSQHALIDHLKAALQRKDELLRRWLKVGEIRETGEALREDTQKEVGDG